MTKREFVEAFVLARATSASFCQGEGAAAAQEAERAWNAIQVVAPADVVPVDDPVLDPALAEEPVRPVRRHAKKADEAQE